jgi:hypothetical protein
MSEKNTTKPLRTIWEDDVGKAGNFAEVEGRGGIITFDLTRSKGSIHRCLPRAH